MILTDTAIQKITTRTVNRIALEMDCSVYTVKRWLDANEANGDMTKAKAVQIIFPTQSKLCPFYVCHYRQFSKGK